MIVRGTIVNGGWTNDASRVELLVRISVDEAANASESSPSKLRNRTAVLVLGEPPSVAVDDLSISQPEGASPASGEATPATVAEHVNGP